MGIPARPRLPRFRGLRAFAASAIGNGISQIDDPFLPDDSRAGVAERPKRNMEIDLYQSCPCHAEKKIKFCCGKNVAAGLQNVLSLHESRQTAAALDQLDQLIRAEGPRDCLLLARSQLLLNLERTAEAGQTVRQFLATNPGHPAGLERLATVLAMEGQAAEAWSALQDAMDHLPGGDIPVGFANGFRAVGWALLSRGLHFAAGPHADMACFLDGTERARDRLWLTILQMIRNDLIAQRGVQLIPLPDDFPETAWKKKYINAMRAVNRCQFRKAADLIHKALETDPDEPRLLLAAAAVSLACPDRAAAHSAWRRVADCPVLKMPERIEAELLARRMVQPAEQVTDVVQAEWELHDLDPVRERLAGQSRILDTGLNPEEVAEGQPPPRMAGVLLDRGDLSGVDDATTWQEVPVVMAHFALFGRETDRPARLVLRYAQEPPGLEAIAWLRGQLEGLIGQIHENRVGEVVANARAVSAEWSLPQSTARHHFERLTKERQFYVAREILPRLKFAELGQRSLQEAAGEPDLVVQCQALVCELEMSNDAREWAPQWGEAVRSACGLPAIAPVRSEELLTRSVHSPWLVRYLDLDGMPTPALSALFGRSQVIGDIRTLRMIAPRLLARTDRAADEGERARQDVNIHLVLAQVAVDDGQCLEHFAQARGAARKAGVSAGMVLVREFEQCFVREKFDRLPEIIREIQLHHGGEQGVREELFRSMVEFGMVTPDGKIMMPTAEAEPEPSRVWTPESSQPAAAKSSGLWLPGQ